MPPARTPDDAARRASEARDSLIDTIAALVFVYLPLTVQAITLPALSKAWKQWAIEQRAKERALEAARAPGQHDRTIFDREIFYVPLWAAQRQQLSVVQKRRFQLRAVADGDVSAVAWFGVATHGAHSHKGNLCSTAASWGQLEALQWLRSRGCNWDTYTCSWAARGGHLAVLQWLRANGCDWSAATCSSAARRGDLTMMQGARAKRLRMELGDLLAGGAQ